MASLCSPAPPSRSKAEPLYRECLAARRRLLGPRHPDTLVSLSNLGTLLRSLGRLEEAAPLQEAALQLARETLGRRHSDTLAYLSNLGLLRLAQLHLLRPAHLDMLQMSLRLPNMNGNLMIGVQSSWHTSREVELLLHGDPKCV